MKKAYIFLLTFSFLVLSGLVLTLVIIMNYGEDYEDVLYSYYRLSSMFTLGNLILNGILLILANMIIIKNHILTKGRAQILFMPYLLFIIFNLVDWFYIRDLFMTFTYRHEEFSDIYSNDFFGIYMSLAALIVYLINWLIVRKRFIEK